MSQFSTGFGGFNNLFQRTTSTIPSLTNLFLNRNRDSRGRQIQQQPAQTPEGRAVQTGNIPALIDRQVQGTEEAQTAAIGDRERAVQILQEFLDRQNPLADQVSSSIQGGLDNPDVLTDEDIARLEARFNSIRARGLQDQIDQASTDFAGRGIAGSGLQGGQLRNLNEQALQDIIRNISDLAVQQNTLRNQNLNQLRELGANFSTAQRGQDQEVSSLISQIIANTNREAPDLSGFASLAADQQQSEFDNLVQAALVDLLNTQQSASSFTPLNVFSPEDAVQSRNTVLEQFLEGILQ